MCGITGKIDFDAPVSPRLIEAMCDTLIHRGPDSRGVHCDQGVGLGIQRLAVIDLETGAQPVFSEDESVVVVLNGEIYNYVEVRQELEGRGHTFRTNGDTETIVHLYEEFGERCVDRLRGMFAFALWDQRARRLLLARDRVGKKPLFYRIAGRTLWFASELRGLFIDSAIPRRPNFAAIDSYLRFQYVPHPLTAFSGIHKLPPAHTLSWAGDVPRINRYWQLNYVPKRRETMTQAAPDIRDVLIEATRIRLRSDVPVGAFLSGGLDSSTVVAAMAQAGASHIETFSIGFDEKRFDESGYARQVADRYSTVHHEFRIRADATTALPRLVWHYGEPFADSSALPSFHLSEMTRQHVTVALTGDGGDESFGGYDRYRAQLYACKLDALPLPLRSAVSRAALRLGPGAHPRTLRSRLARAGEFAASPPDVRYAGWMSIFKRRELDTLYEPAHAAALAQASGADEIITSAWAMAPAASPLDKMLAVDIETYLPGDLLVKMDIASMAHSLEVRSPLLDHVLMERTAAMPAELKVSGTSKHLLKEIARPWLPAEIIDRPKAGFGVPIAEWFRAELRSLPEHLLLDPRSIDRGIFRPNAVQQLIRDHTDGRADNASRIWALVQLELWFRTYVDQAPQSPLTLDLPVT